MAEIDFVYSTLASSKIKNEQKETFAIKIRQNMASFSKYIFNQIYT